MAEEITTEILEDESVEEKADKGGFLNAAIRFVLTILVIVSVAFLLRSFVFQSYEIPSGSMEETIMPGNLVFAEKITTYFTEPSKGQIVTFDDPEVASRILIKRVIATEGQKIDLKDGSVYIDGQKLVEPYTDGKPTYPINTKGSKQISYPYTVPKDHIWMMGDNRTASQDSRYFGAVPVSSVQGHALFIYWPISDIGAL